MEIEIPIFPSFYHITANPSYDIFVLQMNKMLTGSKIRGRSPLYLRFLSVGIV